MPRTIRRTETSFAGADGTRLSRRSWLAGGPERAVALVHGFGEHSARYDEMAEWLAGRGCAVHAYDHRGHGLSHGPRNHVRSFEEYVDDLMLFLEVVRAAHAGLPLVLIGHSMGGLISARTLALRSPAVDCAVLSGSALALSPELSRVKQLTARLLSRIAPTVRSSSGLPTEGLSRDPEVIRRYQADPLVDTSMTVSLGAELIAAQRTTAELGAHVSVPLLGLHGEDDPICPAAGTQHFMQQVRTPASACKVYPGLRHEIFNEPEREQVWLDVLRFVREVEAGAAE